MATANLANASSTVDTSLDSVVIVDNFQSIRGGRTLVVGSFPDAVIKAGHPIIVETATGDHKPFPIASGALGTLPTGHTYAGILISSILAAKPFAGIMVRGTVNPTAFGTASGYPYTSILTALKAALPNVDFRAD
jgi:hypothetical protein